ncbi:MAG: hypothetical protein Q7R80_02390 [bacterium]|nr:hypothetical protein [bacterium]
MRRTIIAAFIAIGLAVSSTGCAGEPEAIEAAKAKGYLNPRVTGRLWLTGQFSCWDEEDTGYELAALDKNERPVKLIACCHFTCSVREALF